MLTVSRCQEIYEKLCEVIPGGVNSPARAWRGIGEFPLIAASAKGAVLHDIDGDEYIDYCGSWGALIHGHADPQICEVAKWAIELGSSFGMSTEIEEKLARCMLEALPGMEQVRFVSSGTEATMSAVRLARGYTKKSYIVKFTGHYHGHADLFLVQAGSGVAGLSPTSSSAGIPQGVIEQTICLPYNDMEVVQRFFTEDPRAHELAAVILEPIACNMGVVPTSPDLMRLLREETLRVGALLIFDEVITGFRVSPNGAQDIYPEKPDLATYGKIIGGGFPAAAFAGSREIMETLAPNGTVYQAGTLSGNPVAMAAGLSALQRLKDPIVYEELEHKTKVITTPLRAAIERLGLKACVQERGSLFTLFFGIDEARCFEDVQSCDLEVFREYFHFMRERGVLVSPSQFEACFVSRAHSLEQLEKTRDAAISFLESIST